MLHIHQICEIKIQFCNSVEEDMEQSFLFMLVGMLTNGFGVEFSMMKQCQ